MARFLGFLMMCIGCFWIGLDSTNPVVTHGTPSGESEIDTSETITSGGSGAVTSVSNIYVGYPSGHATDEENTFVNPGKLGSNQCLTVNANGTIVANGLSCTPSSREGHE